MARCYRVGGFCNHHSPRWSTETSLTAIKTADMTKTFQCYGLWNDLCHVITQEISANLLKCTLRIDVETDQTNTDASPHTGHQQTMTDVIIYGYLEFQPGLLELLSLYHPHERVWTSSQEKEVTSSKMCVSLKDSRERQDEGTVHRAEGERGGKQGKEEKWGGQMQRMKV